jgi:hypothetical protein
MANPTTLILGDPSTVVDLVPTVTKITADTFTSDTFPGVAAFSSCLITVQVGTFAGTGPTLNVYVQTLMPDGTSWCDVAAFTQVSASSVKRCMGLTNGGALEFLQTDGTLTAGTIRQMPWGDTWRIKYIVGGTNPSVPLTVAAKFIV